METKERVVTGFQLANGSGEKGRAGSGGDFMGLHLSTSH